ncbi:MAG: MBL fold metallo-hydrolase [Deltaproteobacteria bacterium]|nr:MBL fold metallo-hydrolase [Deltaproteobacteria bacterium]
MIIRILGCGTSTGVPIPACSCQVCTSSDPRNNRTRASALITFNDQQSLLIDACTDLRHQVLKWGVKNVHAVLFTHPHSDHILGLDDLRGFNFVQSEPIPCFACKDTLQELRRIFPYAFEPPPNYLGGQLVQLDFHEISPPQPFIALGKEIQPFLLMHGTKAATGYRIGDFAYATDCNHIPPQSKALLKGLRCLILDGLRHQPHATHFTISQAIEVAMELNAEITYLTHMTHDVDYESVSAKLPAKVRLAYDGLEIKL